MVSITFTGLYLSYLQLIKLNIPSLTRLAVCKVPSYCERRPVITRPFCSWSHAASRQAPSKNFSVFDNV